MIIDAHAHLPGTDYAASAKKLLESMDRAGIDRAALIASWGEFGGVEKMLEIAAKYPERFFVIDKMSPLKSYKHEFKRLIELLGRGVIKGVKFYTGYEYFFAGDRSVITDAVIRTLVDRDVPVIFHTGDTYSGEPGAKLKYAHPLTIDDLATDHPDLKIIMAHLGNPWMTDAAAVLYKNPNVYADISGWVYGEFTDEDRDYLTRKLMDARGYLGSLDKLLFGSDWPISDQASYVEFVRHLPITEEEKQAIFSENAKKLFKL